ncbi:hypothetical protein BH23PLA1_BH23PLA1_31740 [soil metagenome]
MRRRELLGTLGMGAAAVAVTGRSVLADDHNDHDIHAHDDHIKIMEECAKLCNEAASHCLKQICDGKGDAEKHAKAVQFTVDCQTFCYMTAALAGRHSPLSGVAHEANAKACEACAEVCDPLAENAEIMKKCAEHCRKCAEVCREAAKQGHHDHG